MAMLPYMSVYSSEKNFLPTGYHGIGDVNVMARYAFVNHFGDRVDSRLSAGAGVELPTGKYQQQLSDGTIMHNYQPGSGVVNVIGILSGGVRTHKYGTAFTASYRYNGTNKLGYHRGNAANINIEVFRDIYAGKIRVLPKLMMLLENSSRNLLKDLPYSGNTARKFVFAGCGLDVYYRQLMLSVAGQIPVFQEITHGQIEGKGRTQISVNYIF